MRLYRTLALSLALLATGTQAQTPAEFTQSIIDDMQKPNDGVQLGYQRHHYAGTHMGLMARGDYTPGYWSPANKSLKNATWWTGISPWWNVLPMQGNAATQTRIEVGTVAALARDKGTNNWRPIYNGVTGWAGNYDAPATYYLGPANEVKGTLPGYPTKLYLPPAGQNTLHGGGGVFQINSQGIDGLVLCTAARLVGPDATNAKYALWSGADWYPYVGFNVQANAPSWIPGIVTERFKKITPQWQSFCAAPLDVPGRNGDDAHYPADKTGVFMSTAQLMANPVAEPVGLLPPVVDPPVVEPPVVEPPVVEPPCTMPARKAGQKPSTALRVISDTLAACGQ